MILLWLGLSSSPLLAQTTADGNPAVDPSEPAELVIWERPIAVFRSPIAHLSPSERRDLATSRIQGLPSSALQDPLKFESTTLGDLRGVAFYSGKNILFTLIEEDLDPVSGETLAKLGERVRKNLDDLRLARIEQRRPELILRGIGISVAATVLLAGLFWFLIWLNRKIRRLFVRRTARLSQLRREGLDLRPAFLQISRRLTGLVFSAIGLIACYLWITLLLAQFPYTSPWAGVLGGHVAEVGASLLSSALAAIPNLLILAVIFFLTRGTARLTERVLLSFENSAEDKLLSKDSARATRRIATVLIWIFGLVIAYPYIPGSNSDAFKGVSVLVGLMISLGSTGLVNQIMSGFVVLYSGAVRTGEYARVGDVEGVITEIGLLSTKVMTPKHEFVTVPNAVLISRDTLNYSRIKTEQRTELATSVSIGYDTPWRQVHELLLLAADRTPGIRETPAPRVVQNGLGDFYVIYELRFVPADITRKGATLSDLHQRIQDAFQAAGVQIMSPNFVAQPAEAVIPPPQGQGDASRQTKSSPPASGDPIAGTLQVADET